MRRICIVVDALGSLAGSLALLVGLAGPPAVAQGVVDSTLKVELVVDGIPGVPTSMAFLGPDDILVLEKNTGRVRRVIAGTLQPAPVLDLAVNVISERGLLGITLDPLFPVNGRVWLYVTESETGVDGGLPVGNRIYRYRWDGAALVEPLLVLDLPVTPGPNHDGGVIEFGPDDRLYAVIGDLNRNGKLQNFPAGEAPDHTGVILRVDTTGGPLPDNPFWDPTDPTNPLGSYHAYGVRNSFGFAFDPVSGDLWDTENGPSTFDEINRLDPGANSGWERIMGPDARDVDDVDDLWLAPGAFYVDPSFSWASTVAPTAIAFAESTRMGCGNLHRLFVGDNNCGQIYRFDLTADRKDLVLEGVLADRVADNVGNRCALEQGAVIFGTGFGVITDIENGPDGALYVVSGSRGAIYRIVTNSASASVTDADQDAVADSCDCADDDAGAWAAPEEIGRLRLVQDSGTWIGWDPQAAIAGPAVRYDVVSGALADLSVDAGFAMACRIARALVDPELDDPLPAPPPGEGLYYLVRPTHPCGDASFGPGREDLDTGTLPHCPR